jgi:uncharacterized membrane protein YeaQ/YmgE (transglycosylase-associated protein family)
MTVGIILAIVVGGLIVGALARLALPGPDPMPIWATILLGWAGSILGGVISWIFLGRGPGIFLSLVGAIVILYLYRRFVQKRPITGPRSRSL